VNPRPLRHLLVALALLGAAISPSVPGATAAPGTAGPKLDSFRGLGAWVDMFEDRAWARPAKAVADMASHGVRTVYLQTSNYSQDAAVVHPDGVSSFLKAAHARDMDVVAWYLPGFAKLGRDFTRSMAAIGYRSSTGERFDAFGLDIEASILGPPSERTKRLLKLSHRIRKNVGAEYPLGAIIPSPVGITLNEGYWPKFPYAGLSEIYDVIVPMGYFTYHVKGPAKVHDETARNVEIIREKTGDDSIPIHMIGGIADEASGLEVEAFVEAVREHGLLGASIYNWSLSGAEDWAPLEAIPANPKQSPALPLSLPFAGEVGNIKGQDVTHPKEVVYRAGPLAGSHTLRLEAFDIQADEVHVWVNWELVAALPASGARDSWSAQLEIPLPDDLLRDGDDNYIVFVASGEFPDWNDWGVRTVSLV
jgi:hypothetical protein